LHYEPNQAAISFKKGRSMTLGVILPDLREEFFSIAINGIEDMATRNGYTVLIGQSHDNTEREALVLEAMRKQRVDGILVSLAKTTRAYTHFEALKPFSIPVVFFDRVPDWPEAHSVSCNLGNSTGELIEFLVGKGHKRIGFIKGPDSLIHSRQRLEGYEAALKKHGIKKDRSLIVSTDLSKTRTRDAMQKLLALRERPTAVIAFNDYVALEAIQYCRIQGVRINQEISFVSYANLPVTSYLDSPPIASVEQFPYQQAEKATEILLRLIDAREDIPDSPVRLLLESKVVFH